MTTTAETDRLRGLVEAGIALSSELSLDDLLQKLAEIAAALTGARYAALGVIDQSGTALERFLHTGVDADTVAKIGALPRGRGILGALITDARPLRLESIADDPRSVGFPPHHPPMRGFLGVPILLRGRAFGNLYLTEKREGSFTAADQELVETLASQAAVAIENARLYEAATAWSDQLEALNEVGTALASEIELARLLELIARRLRGLIGARLVTIALPADDGTLRIEAADGEHAGEIVGLQLERAGSKSGRVLERRRAERVDSLLDDPEVDQESVRRLGARSGLYVPLVAGGRAIGVLAAHDREGSDPRFTEADLRLTETFAPRAAVAVDLSARVAGDALRRVVEAQELERRRLARELHDQTGQELTSVLLGLKAVEEAKTDEERNSGPRRRARTGRRDAPRRPPACGRAAAEGTRRLRPRRGARASARDVRGTDRDARGARGADRRPTPERRRNSALPDRAGGADEHRQARAGELGQHRARAQPARDHCRDRGRRPRLRCPTPAPKVSACWGWASGSRCWAAS